MTAKAWYKEWFNSPFYHKLYFERDEKEAESFIRKLINQLHPAPGSRMLDVACGRGRHSKILSSMGFQVTGIDISPDSIAAAKRYENDQLEFYIHDMRLPFGSTILIMYLTFLQASAISGQDGNMMMQFVPLPEA